MATEPERKPESKSLFAAETRQLTGVWDIIRFVLSAGVLLYISFYLLNFQAYFNFDIEPGPYRLSALAVFLVLIYLTRPWRKGRDLHRIPWYDFVLIALSIIGTFYAVTHWTELRDKFTAPTPLEVTMGAITIVAVVEASRRAAGWTMPVVVGIFFVYTLTSQYWPGVLELSAHSFTRTVSYLYWFAGGLTGMVLGIILTVVVAFFVFGVLVQYAGGARFFMGLALAVAGRFSGGPGKVSVLASSLLGMISGSPIANAPATGLITIPMMIKAGFPKTEAAAIEAVAATGGLIMPPVMGAVAFLMAEFLETSYWSVCVVAFVPAVLYYVSLFMTVHFDANKLGLKGLPRTEIPPVWKTLKEGWELLLPIAVLVYLLAVLGWSPERSILYAVGALLVLTMFRKARRWTWKTVAGAVRSTVDGLIVVVPTAAVGAMVFGLVSLTGMGVAIVGALIKATGGNLLVLLLLSAVITYIFGMGISMLVSYLLGAALIAPMLIRLGVDPFAAHLFVLFWNMFAFFTPPVAIDIWITSAIAGAPMMRSGFVAMRLALASYLVPFAFVYNAALILHGDIASVIIAVVTAVIGVTAIAAAGSGYLLTNLSWLQRTITFIAGVLLIWPEWLPSAIGLVLFALVAVWNLRQRRTRAIQLAPAKAT